MRALKPLLLALMMVAMLPWGAYAKAPGTASANLAAVALAQSATAQSVLAVETAEVRAPEVTAAPFGKTCKLALLPGSACNTGFPLPGAIALPAPDPSRARLGLILGRVPASACPPPRTHPPRLS